MLCYNSRMKKKYLQSIEVKGRRMRFPTFFPDATRAVVRGVDTVDLKNAGIEGVIVNTYHLMNQPGDEFLHSVGGVKRFMNWDGFVISDSGGFQIMSLIHKFRKQGKVTSKGVKFDNKIFTPEKSIEVQFNLGTDIIIVLDYFTSPRASLDEIKRSVDITIEWAKRAKEEYLRQLEIRKIKERDRPLLLGVIQGGANLKERERCAKVLIEIGFDGYGYGGWPMVEEGNFNYEVFKKNAELTPDDKLRFALGIGKPWEIIKGVEYGYHIFDCVLPTRDARHKRLYVFNKELDSVDNIFESPKELFGYVYLSKERYYRDMNPISKFCDCFTCKDYSISYLKHLFSINDTLAYRLASIHNLHLYSTLLKKLREYKLS